MIKTAPYERRTEIQMINYMSLPGLSSNYDLKIKGKVSPELVIQIICDYYKVHPIRLQSRCRDRELVDARKMITYYLRKLTNLSYKAIGEKFGLDHTSIISYIRQMEGHLETDEKMIRDCEQIRLLL